MEHNFFSKFENFKNNFDDALKRIENRIAKQLSSKSKLDKFNYDLDEINRHLGAGYNIDAGELSYCTVKVEFTTTSKTPPRPPLCPKKHRNCRARRLRGLLRQVRKVDGIGLLLLEGRHGAVALGVRITRFVPAPLAPSHPSHLVAFEAQLEREAVETVTPVSAQGVDVDAFGR